MLQYIYSRLKSPPMITNDLEFGLIRLRDFLKKGREVSSSGWGL